MNQNTQTENIDNLITLLNDGQWHSSNELAAKVSYRFAHTVYQARKQGYCIETRKIKNLNYYEYRIDNNSASINYLRQLAKKIPEKIPYLKMLILFGSRVVGNTHSKSDWDFAVTYNSEKINHNTNKNELLQISQIIGEVLQINGDTVDVVDLEKSTPLLAHFIARDGEVIYEQQPGEFQQFKQKALLNDRELEAIENNLKQQINGFLKEWAEQ
ncbi:MAG: nucleotidyltransferase domain-containing protein [Xenococcaceae cyanobacterium]